jgi:dsRNA-specific ribonuclease
VISLPFCFCALSFCNKFCLLAKFGSIYRPIISHEASFLLERNPVSQWQEMIQKQKCLHLDWEVISDKETNTFESIVKLHGQTFASSKGPSKKLAKLRCSVAAIQRLKENLQ